MAEPPLSPEEISHRGFSTTFRGFDTAEVKAYLGRVADELREATVRERELHRRVAEAEHRAAHPVLDSDTLSRAVGEETARILASAQEAARELKAKAEDNVGRMLREAHDHAQRVRSEAEAVLGRRNQEVDEVVEAARKSAAAEAAVLAEQARQEAAAAMAEVQGQAGKLVEEAQAARAQILGDMSRRRRRVLAQVEQLRAGRGRLLDAYRVVRRTLDEVTVELEKVEAEAREAAGAVSRRAAGEPESTSTTAPADAGGGGGGSSQHAGQPPADPPAPEPPVVPEERRLSSLRILRPADDSEAGAPRVVEAPTAVEAVRLMKSPAPDPEHHLVQAGAPAVPSSAAAAAPDLVPSSEPPTASVDALFARIRADREHAVSRAHEVLAAPRDEVLAPVPGSTPADSVAPEPSADSDEALRERRDRAVEDIQAKLARRLKRALQDEQNEVLDRLREVRGRPADAPVLVAADEQVERYRTAGLDLLAEAGAAGGGFVGVTDPTPVDILDVAGELALSLAGPLRRGLEACLEAGGEDVSVLVEGIGAAYRECRVQRVERAAADAAVAAFCRGTLAASGEAALRWVVDDDGVACADCDDNALAGPMSAGVAYPTGQPHPPAHTGCRCLLAPVP